MMVTPLVSIVLPVYKVEKHISACIQSITCQDYKNIEVVLVDDGTPDNSIKVAERILTHASFQYRTIHQKNKGVSSARNCGIKEATSDWIMMIDPDDVIQKDYVSSLIKNIDLYNSSQSVFCEFQAVNESNVNKMPQWDNGVLEFDRKTALHAYLTREVRFIVTGMLINRNFLIKHGIEFDEKCRYSEDVLFVWKVLCCLDKAILIRKPLYNYLRRPGSTMGSSSKEKILTSYNALQELYNEYIVNLEGEDILISQFIPRYILGLLHGAAKMLSYQDFLSLGKSIEADKWFSLNVKYTDRRIAGLMKLYNNGILFCYAILRLF